MSLFILCAIRKIIWPFNCFSHFPRFRSGFKLAFRWCPCIKATEKDKLKLMSPSLYQTSYRKSRTSFNTETQLNEKEKTSFTLTQLTLWFPAPGSIPIHQAKAADLQKPEAGLFLCSNCFLQDFSGCHQHWRQYLDNTKSMQVQILPRIQV